MRISLFAAAAACVIALGACADSSPNISSASISPAAGTYSLRTVDGAALPWTSGGVTLVSETATVNADGSYTTVNTFSSGLVQSDHGIVTVSGASATISQSNGDVFPATLAGGTLTITAGGHAFVLQQN